MKTTFLSGIALAVLMGTASAADLPRRSAAPAPAYVPVAYSWTGFYAGLNAGFGWGTSTFADLDFGPSGGVFGGQIGYNWQNGPVVWGVETDIQWTGISDSGGCGGGLSCEVKSDWFGTVRGRVGYTVWDRWLPYITGGLAYGNVSATHQGFGGKSETKAGWTLGAGAEYAWGGGWSGKVEYLFVDLGDFNCGVVDCGFTGTRRNVSYQANIVRAGVNYRF